MSKIKQILKINSSLCLSLYLLGIILCLGIALLNTQGLIEISPLWGRLGFFPYLVMDVDQNQNSNWIYNTLPILMIDQIIYQQWVGVFLFSSIWIVFVLFKNSNTQTEILEVDNKSDDNR